MTRFYIEYLVITCILSLVLGPIIIPELIKLKVGQSIREDGPQSHLKKAGTPTMGGIIFIIASLISVLFFAYGRKNAIFCVICMALFGLIGFIDDYLIVVKKTNDGLSPSHKMLAQIIVAIGLLATTINDPEMTKLYIPFAGNERIDFGILFYPFALFVILALVNSVNLTDGLDGLASSVSFVYLIGFAIITSLLGHVDVSVFSMILAGGLLGFLRFNWYPAKVFMGDAGSLAIGGGFAGIAILSGTSLYIPIIGIIFVLETLSVIIQVYSFKTTGKRVFLMSPIHHHFEAKGWHEIKIVIVFSLITIFVTGLVLISLM